VEQNNQLQSIDLVVFSANADECDKLRIVKIPEAKLFSRW
jgi:hypothetical protein